MFKLEWYLRWPPLWLAESLWCHKMLQLGYDLNAQLHCPENGEGHQIHRHMSSATGGIGNVNPDCQGHTFQCFYATAQLTCSFMCTHFTICMGVWVESEGYRGTELSWQTRCQVLRHRQDPQAVRKSSSPFCATLPSQGRGEWYGGGRGGGEQHRTPLALAVACAVVPRQREGHH